MPGTAKTGIRILVQPLPAVLSQVRLTSNPFLIFAGLVCSISSVEHLLSALEGCGVDNARIEIEGGSEIPIIDGSALGWVIEIHKVCCSPSSTIIQSVLLLLETPSHSGQLHGLSLLCVY